MASFAEIAMLRTDLGYPSAMPIEVTAYAEGCIESARARLAGDGIVLDTENSLADLMTLTMYAAWIYRKRDSGAAMPQMLRQDINDRKTLLATSQGGLA